MKEESLRASRKTCLRTRRHHERCVGVVVVKVNFDDVSTRNSNFGALAWAYCPQEPLATVRKRLLLRTPGEVAGR